MLRQLATEALRAARRGAATATGVSIELLRRLNAVLADPDAPSDPAAAMAELRALLGLAAPGPHDDSDVHRDPGMSREDELRERFAVLLSRSQSPAPPDGRHPAMDRIVGELAPDEARILRLLREEGPQPVAAVRASPFIGRGEETVLDHVSLVADRAGCHHPEDGPAYLDNLRRLGLVRVLREELVGHDDYDVIRARPEVAAAEERVTDERNQRVRIDRGHVQLSDLGELLCEVCLS